jgi:hypothetical protein
MGEEKPDEELMGKRKLAPRLSTTFCDVDNYNMARNMKSYTCAFRRSVGLCRGDGGQSFLFNGLNVVR